MTDQILLLPNKKEIRASDIIQVSYDDTDRMTFIYKSKNKQLLLNSKIPNKSEAVFKLFKKAVIEAVGELNVICLSNKEFHQKD